MEFLSFALLILSFAAGEEVQDFPESCQKELQLGSKKYRVTSRTVIHQSCSIHGDVEVELDAPLLFDAVEFHGSVTFLATASFHEACLSVAGPMKIHGSVEFRSCRNNATGSPGGAVYVGGDLHVDGSARFQNCHAESAGGAIYVDGDFWQSGGTMQFDNCSAENGGALSVHGGLQQSGGTLSFGGCSARKWGGAIHLEGDLQHSGGSVNVHDCTASEGGGLYLKEHIVDWTAGSMFASNCSSSRGGAMVAKSLVQSGGQLDFESCGASIEAGVLHLQQDLNQTAGSMSFKGGFAAARGGCAIIENRFWQMGGSMLFSNCTSQRSHGGAIHVGHRGFGGLKASGKLTFRGCSSNSGGAIKVTAGGAEFSNGTFLFEDCIADTGGAVSVSAGHFIHSSGSSTFSRCRALTSVGGALKVEGAQSLFKMRGGSMRFSDCWAFSNGGALFVMKGLRQQGGDIELMNCSSTSQGGGIYIGLRDGGNLEQDAGSISLNKCYVAGGDFQFGFGGGISVGDSVRQSGTIRLENCHVEGGSGAGMKVRRMLNVSGSMSFSSCRATKDGGAFTADSVYVEGGAKLSFDKCRAKAGGALKLDMGFEQQGGDVSFRNCSTWNVGTQVLKLMSENARHGRGGGAIWIRNGNLTQTAGGLRFYGCGGVKGGAVYISEGHLILKGGKQDYVECVASSGGGGVFLHKGHVFQQKTDLTFQSCKAQRKGGAVDVSHGSYYQSPGTLLNITKCVARDHGGGLFASESLHLADVDFRENFAWGSGMAAIARDDVVMDSMHFTGDGESVISAPLVVVQKTVNCTASQQCRLRAREVQVNEFLCPIGAGRYKGRLAEGCLPCVAGRVQILEETNASCAPCPSNSFCSAQYLRAFPGYMLSSDNISRMYHCPNSMACSGGDLPNKTKPMCGNGYTGLGCAECETATHGKSDVDILQCIPCANERWLQAMQISWLIIKDALAFGIAGASLIGDSLEEKQSNVLLNQFMAFAVVAGSTLSSTMNTKTLKQFSSRNSDSVWWSDLLQPDAGASLECILGYLGLPKTVWHSHLISSVTPVLLTLLFAVTKDVPSALMVGSNCFLPRFWGDVGRFFVCYRIEPEADGGQQICRFLPPQPWALLALFVLLFLGVLLGWWRSVTAAERQRAHVIYLTRGYQPRYASWELERLVRKMILRLFTALLPVTLFPALHMAGNTLVLLFAWTVHLHVAPYQRAKWNVTEALLLTTALLMTILSNCMIANDSHWGHSVLTQYVLFFVIVSLALVASVVVLVMFLLQVYQERFAPQDVEKKTLEE